ncbi:MAG: DMT family transporter [Gemmatimonadota bacterium]
MAEAGAATPTGTPMTLLLLAALLVGMGLPLQSGINAQLRLGLGQPLLAALVSFGVGTVALGLITLLVRTTPAASVDLAGIPWWHWTGGLIGAVYIFAAVILAPQLGATTLVGAMVAGQLLASLIYDHFGLVGYPVQPVTWQRLLGVALIGVGVWLVKQPRT